MSQSFNSKKGKRYLALFHLNCNAVVKYVQDTLQNRQKIEYPLPVLQSAQLINILSKASGNFLLKCFFSVFDDTINVQWSNAGIKEIKRREVENDFMKRLRLSRP